MYKQPALFGSTEPNQCDGGYFRFAFVLGFFCVCGSGSVVTIDPLVLAELSTTCQASDKTTTTTTVPANATATASASATATTIGSTTTTTSTSTTSTTTITTTCAHTSTFPVLVVSLLIQIQLLLIRRPHVLQWLLRRYWFSCF